MIIEANVGVKKEREDNNNFKQDVERLEKENKTLKQENENLKKQIEKLKEAEANSETSQTVKTRRTREV